MLNENLRCTTCQQSKVNTAKVTLADLTKYNLELVVGHENDAATLQKYLRHERLHVMMKEGLISRNKIAYGITSIILLLIGRCKSEDCVP